MLHAMLAIQIRCYLLGFEPSDPLNSHNEYKNTKKKTLKEAILKLIECFQQ